MSGPKWKARERDGLLQILACDRQIAAKEQETAVQPVGEAQIPVVLVARRKPTQSADGLGRGLDVAADQAADKDSVERRITLPRVADLLDQLLSARERGRRLPGSITARGDQGLAERQLQLQLQSHSLVVRRHGVEPLESVAQMTDGFQIGRSAHRRGSRLEPIPDSLFSKLRLREVMCNHLRLRFDRTGEVVLKRFGNPAVELSSRLTQQRPVSRILHESMLEQIGRLRGHSASEKQTGRDETVQRRSQLRLRLTRHRGEQGMRKLAADCRRDLRQLFGRAAKPVEPRHQRGIQARGDRQRRGWDRGNRARGGGLAPCFQHRLGHLLHKQGDTVGTLNDVLPNARR